MGTETDGSRMLVTDNGRMPNAAGAACRGVSLSNGSFGAQCEFYDNCGFVRRQKGKVNGSQLVFRSIIRWSVVKYLLLPNGVMPCWGIYLEREEKFNS